MQRKSVIDKQVTEKFLGVKKGSKQYGRKRATYMLGEDLIDRLKEEANNNNVLISDFVIILLNAGLEQFYEGNIELDELVDVGYRKLK
jgi:hypothetical protein